MDRRDGQDNKKEQTANYDAVRRIRALNDRFRRTGRGGRMLITPGIAELGAEAIVVLLREIAAYNDFTGDNDPYGEHDFGALTYLGQKVFWKIDYYDKTLTHGSPDPTDSLVTTRVLTIMLASEY